MADEARTPTPMHTRHPKDAHACTDPLADAHMRVDAHRGAQAFLVRLGLFSHDRLHTYPRVSVLGVVPGKSEAMPVVEVRGASPSAGLPVGDLCSAEPAALRRRCAELVAE